MLFDNCDVSGVVIDDGVEFFNVDFEVGGGVGIHNLDRGLFQYVMVWYACSNRGERTYVPCGGPIALGMGCFRVTAFLESRRLKLIIMAGYLYCCTRWSDSTISSRRVYIRCSLYSTPSLVKNLVSTEGFDICSQRCVVLKCSSTRDTENRVCVSSSTMLYDQKLLMIGRNYA